jgi:hypothetical protein
LNYAVAWKEGHACEGQLLAPVTENPCDRPFWIDNVYCKSSSLRSDAIRQVYSHTTDHLGRCGTDDFGLYKADGSRVGPCTRVKDVKYSCGSGYHDSIKHWQCGN